jgi:hypothetical protein
MFPLNYFWSESKPSFSTKTPETSSKESFSVSKDQSETQTASFLKIREMLSSDEKQREVTRQRQQVLGFDNR